MIVASRLDELASKGAIVASKLDELASKGAIVASNQLNLPVKLHVLTIL
ncbi:hypothetical protein ACTNEO_15935 [Gracilibacillus sp. HCP3S3_G5_1]